MAIFGAGPVGLLAAHSAFQRGAAQVFVRDLIIAGCATPSFIVSHELPLDQSVDAYDKFDRRVDGYTKVLLHPAAT